MEITRGTRHSHPPYHPDHGSDHVGLIGEARVGFAGGIDGDQPEPDRVGSGNDLDALDHKSAAVPEHSHLAGSRGPAAGVDQ